MSKIFNNTKANKTKIAIDKSVSELITIRGIDNLMVKEVCERANIARTTYYYYYKDINEAILEMFHYVDDYFENFVYPEIINLDLIDALIIFSKRYFEMSLDYGIDYSKQIFLAQIRYSDPKVFSSDRGFYKIPIEIFKKQESNKKISEKDPVYLANSFITVIRGIVFDWQIKGGNFDLIGDGLRIIKDYINGILH